MIKVNSIISVILLVILVIGCSESEPETPQTPDPPAEVELEPVLISTRVANPWGMAFIGDNEFLVTEKGGTIFHFKDDQLVNPNVTGAPQSIDFGQGGLLDIVIHPDFENNGWIYMTYTTDEGGGYNTRLSRLRWTGEALEGEEVLFTDRSNSQGGNHFGSRIAFDANNYVYFSIGDRGNRDVFPQSLTVGAGKIHRLHDDGRVPVDNPFYNTDYLETIFSYGHRNPQGLIYHEAFDQLWSHEHGPLGGDELNLIRSRRNYGWPEITYGRNYDGTLITEETERQGMEQPETYWTPSIAPCGMTVISNSIYEGWNGNILMGSLKFDNVVRLEVNAEGYITQEVILQGIGRVRNVQMGRNGHFYVATQDNGIFRIDITE